MLKWFRFHKSALHNSKVQSLPGETFKAWVNMLCVAVECDGFLSHVTDMLFQLRVTQEEFDRHISILKAHKLIEEKNGKLYMHDWAEHQYKSDSSAERTRAYRARKKALQSGAVSVTETLHVTGKKRHGDAVDTDTDTYSDTKPPKSPKGDDPDFLEFWKAYPRRDGKGQAWAAWQKAIRAGTKPGDMIEGAKKYAAIAKPEFTKMPSTWINGLCWQDESLQARGTFKPLNPERDKWLEALYNLHHNRVWPEHYGPKPGQPGCKVPAEFLAEYAKTKGGKDFTNPGNDRLL